MLYAIIKNILKKHLLLFTAISICSLIVLSGCAQKVSDLAGQKMEEVDETRTWAKDEKRRSSVRMLSIAVELYALDEEKLPFKKDANGTYQSYKLIKDSADFNLLQSQLQKVGSYLEVPVDPDDPNRYLEYYSNGDTFLVKAFLSGQSDDCKMNSNNLCEFVIKKALKDL